MAIARRAAELRGELTFLLESSEKNYVYWFERRNKGVFVAATPIDVSAILRERLFEAFDTVVLTSATLAVARALRFSEAAAGARRRRSERVLPQEFDFRQQALLYIPAALPDVRDAGFAGEGGGGNCAAAGMHGGPRVLPFHQLQPDESDFRAGARARSRFPLLMQGTAPRTALLERFRATPGRGAFCHVQFLAGRGRARRAAFLRDRGPAAVCRANRPGRGGARARAATRTAATPSPNIRCPRRCWRSSRASAG